MTETEWLTSTDPTQMLRLRRTSCCGCLWMDHGNNTVSLCLDSRPCEQCDNGPMRPSPIASDRKLRLWAVACWRACPPRNPVTGWFEALCELEELADGHRSEFSWPSKGYICATHHVSEMLQMLSGLWLGENNSGRQLYLNAKECCSLFRVIVGNPWKPVKLPNGQKTCTWCEGSGRRRVVRTTMSCLPCDGRGWFVTPCPWLTWNDGTVPKMAKAIYDERRYGDMGMLADALEDAGCYNETILQWCRQCGPSVRGDWCLDLLAERE